MFGHVSRMYRSSALRGTLNTNVFTWTCVKNVPKQFEQFDNPKTKKQFEHFFHKKCAKPSRNACFENLMIFSSQIWDEHLTVCMSVLRRLHVYEILQMPMNPACTFVTHICQTLKHGTGFQATCLNIYKFISIFILLLKKTVLRIITLNLQRRVNMGPCIEKTIFQIRTKY